MKTLSELIHLSASYLKLKGIDSARRVAEDLIADALHLKRLDLYLLYDRPIQEDELTELRVRLSRRAKGEPAQYISGFVDFYDCCIKVTPSVLIPRQETEILVDRVVGDLEQTSLQGKVLLDLCCGSGCIGIALKKRFPQLQVVSSDISSGALAIAKDNAFANGVDICWVQGDFLEALPYQQFDFVVCNPPYVSEIAYETLDPSVKCYEPKLALVASDNGLFFFKRFALEGKKLLSSKAKVWFEIGFDQGNALNQIFQEPFWRNLRLEKDWAGHDRFFSLETE
ncbi:Release factor glutamine methyltransferase [Chlamydiales bacterium STE3]|nr:Release factor glutamine methyltransferase [Chlamydiales bacterium STE3]